MVIVLSGHARVPGREPLGEEPWWIYWMITIQSYVYLANNAIHAAVKRPSRVANALKWSMCTAATAGAAWLHTSSVSLTDDQCGARCKTICCGVRKASVGFRLVSSLSAERPIASGYSAAAAAAAAAAEWHVSCCNCITDTLKACTHTLINACIVTVKTPCHLLVSSTLFITTTCRVSVANHSRKHVVLTPSICVITTCCSRWAVFAAKIKPDGNVHRQVILIQLLLHACASAFV